jgi:hypothetical protein
MSASILEPYAEASAPGGRSLEQPSTVERAQLCRLAHHDAQRHGLPQTQRGTVKSFDDAWPWAPVASPRWTLPSGATLSWVPLPPWCAAHSAQQQAHKIAKHCYLLLGMSLAALVFNTVQHMLCDKWEPDQARVREDVRRYALQRDDLVLGRRTHPPTKHEGDEFL